MTTNKIIEGQRRGETMTEMKIKALAPWFGGKRNLAPRIVELLGSHSVYWDPFCGSMAVLMVKPSCRMETVNDLHQDLWNMACVIQDRFSCLQLYKRLHRILMHEELMAEARDKTKEPYKPGVDRAFWYFINSWIGRNGIAGTQDHNQHFCRRFTAKGGSPSVRLNSAITSIPAWRRRLKRVCILNTDAFEILERINDTKDAAIYVDPPYFEKGSKYKHDFEPQDHDRLAKLLHRFKLARIVLSYYDHPRLKELYADWHREEIVISKALAHQGTRGKNKTKATEVLLVNGQIEQGLF